MAYTTINKSTDYFNTKLYTGNGSTQSITGVGFQPDWVWIKNRGTAYSHQLYDVLRGATKRIFSDTTQAEGTDANTLTSFDSDGFSLGTNVGVNESSINHVAWNWLANGSGSANTDGSISSTVSANTTSGFSIVTYTGNGTAGATIGHGLGDTPKMIIIKNRSSVKAWGTYHSSVGATKYLFLNDSGVATTYTQMFNDTEPTSSVFSVGTDLATNVSSDNYVAYCFAEVKGYSKFDSYTGNGNANGPFIYTGFKPAFVLTKNTDSISDWILNDNKRLGYNPNNYRFKANDTVAEQTVTDVDLLSNGFKVRTTSTDHNTSGNTIIYMAFAAAPLVGTNNIPATAR